eukprot:SAG11_NODE_81_length_17673_cov_7.702572_16_plen_165_part_00
MACTPRAKLLALPPFGFPCDGGTCQCEQGYSGENCDEVVDPCAGVDCGGPPKSFDKGMEAAAIKSVVMTSNENRLVRLALGSVYVYVALTFAYRLIHSRIKNRCWKGFRLWRRTHSACWGSVGLALGPTSLSPVSGSVLVTVANEAGATARIRCRNAHDYSTST